MQGFTKKELIGSLVCPILTALWGGIRFFGDLMWGAELSVFYIHRWVGTVAVIAGGILPIILTLKLKIHTERYLKGRLKVIIIAYLIFCLIAYVSTTGFQNVLYPILYFSAVIYQVLNVHDNKTSTQERVILIMSDLTLYWGIYEGLYLFCDLLDV